MSTEGMVEDPARAADTRRAAMLAAEAEATSMGNLVLCVFAGTFVFIAAVVMNGSRQAAITISPTSFAVRAAGYSAAIPRADIDSVRLASRLTGLGAKRNGFQWGNAYAGRFEMRPYGTARLFVNATTPPFVVVYAKSGVVIVNERDSAATRRLFAALRP